MFARLNICNLQFIVDLIMREVLSEDKKEKPKDGEKKHNHSIGLPNLISKSDKDRISSLKRNLIEKTVYHENTGCNEVICEESHHQCLRCETCFCKQ